MRQEGKTLLTWRKARNPSNSLSSSAPTFLWATPNAGCLAGRASVNHEERAVGAREIEGSIDSEELGNPHPVPRVGDTDRRSFAITPEGGLDAAVGGAEEGCWAPPATAAASSPSSLPTAVSLPTREWFPTPSSPSPL